MMSIILFEPIGTLIKYATTQILNKRSTCAILQTHLEWGVGERFLYGLTHTPNVAIVEP